LFCFDFDVCMDFIVFFRKWFKVFFSNIKFFFFAVFIVVVFLIVNIYVFVLGLYGFNGTFCLKLWNLKNFVFKDLKLIVLVIVLAGR
jgi:hypothetical protein